MIATIAAEKIRDWCQFVELLRCGHDGVVALKSRFTTLKRRHLKGFVPKETLMNDIISILKEEGFM